MPKNPPDQIHIRIDTQEQRSGIPDLLAVMPQVHIEVIPLRTGDYDVGGDPCRVIERKTGSDFLASLTEGRLFAQLAALRKSRFAPILLLEGDPLCVDYSQMHPESIRGALAYITAIMRVPVLPSGGPADSAHLVYATARQCQGGRRGHGHAASGPSTGRRRASLPEQQLQIVLSLPGVGVATARAVCARFGSLHDLLSADAATLATVPGIGPLHWNSCCAARCRRPMSAAEDRGRLRAPSFRGESGVHPPSIEPCTTQSLKEGSEHHGSTR